MRFLLPSILVLISFHGCNSTEKDGTVVYDKLTVPENRSNPNAGTIDISYAVISADKPSDRPPIVYIQGGPGGGSLSMVPLFSNSPLNEYHDIILFDARGTGNSDAYCVDLGSKIVDVMAMDLTVEEEYQATLEICESCRKELKADNVDLAGYSSIENAADLEDLRKKLKIDSWILYGGSYGTRVGLTYLRAYEHAEAAVFMGLFPLEVNMYEGFMEGFVDALNHLSEMCLTEEICNEKYPRLKDSLYSLIDELRENPKKVSYQGKDFYINAQDLLLLIHQMLYQRQTIQQIPALVHSLSNDQASNVITNSINRTVQTISFINIATYWSVQAREELQFNEEKAIQKDLETYDFLKPGPAFLITDQMVLKQWHSHRSAATENERVITETPILIINGMFDPITPIRNARATKYLPNATLVEFPNEGHTVFNPCFYDLFEQFVSSDYQSVSPACATEGALRWQ